MYNSKALLEKWQDLLEAEGVPAIVTSGKKKIVARILEEQEKDLDSLGMMPTEEELALQEANVAGDADNAAAGTVKNGGAIVSPGPTVMGLVRRAIPQMMAFDTIGVQPMNGPTGQVFCLRSIYGGDANIDPATGEAFAPGKAPRAHWSGSHSADQSHDKHPATVGGLTITDLAGETYPLAAVDGTYYSYDDGEQVRVYQVVTGAAGAGVTWADAAEAAASVWTAEVGEGLLTSIAEVMEGFNGTSGNPYNEMSFRIDKQTVEAKSRQLKAQYSLELAQDLKAVHGMDADSELQGILSNEIMVEINREVVTLINAQSQVGASGKTGGTTTAGVFDLTDANDVKGARWAGESYKALLIQIEKEANEIGRQTGRGNGNWILASRNVVSALSMTDVFVGPAAQGMQNGTMNTDTNQSVFAGILGGRFKVYIDQYAQEDYVLVGYKGATEMDAGIFYSPYVPLTPLRGADSKNLQPVMAFKTRYGMQINPFVAPENAQIFSNSLARGIGQNQYFRRFRVVGL